MCSVSPIQSVGMKKSGAIPLSLVTAVAATLTGCYRRPGIDPCAPATFNEFACQEAVSSGGYHYNGTWYPMTYSHPYPYYYESYHTYVGRGGAVRSVPSTSYVRPGGTVTRGGFGSSGSRFGGSSYSSGGSRGASS